MQKRKEEIMDKTEMRQMAMAKQMMKMKSAHKKEEKKEEMCPDCKMPMSKYKC